MSTGVSVHILLKDTAHRDSIGTLPAEVYELFATSPGLPFGAQRLTSEPPMPWVVQIGIPGLNKIARGKRLLVELHDMGYEARLSFSHGPSFVWWPEAPTWPTWEWPPAQVAEWVRRQPQVRRRHGSGGRRWGPS